jgi:hypothetical protein
MTTEQQSQFNLFACIPRCLIHLAARTQHTLTAQEFCDRFGHMFHNPETQYGLLNPDHIPEIARSLSLPSSVGPQVSPTRLVALADYDQVATLHRTGSMLLVRSLINLNQGATDPVGHCSVLHEIEPRFFTLWTPTQGGTDHVLPFQQSDWAGKQCSAMVLV